jgi:serine/threonine protein kinase
MSLTTGSRLGVYEVIGTLGAGGMGEVYRARDTRLQRDVALKILPESVAADPDRLARFEREARVLASLNHSNIAQIYGVEESAGRPQRGSCVFSVTERESLVPSSPRILVSDAHTVRGMVDHTNYDMGRDGRLIVVEEPPADPRPALHVVLGWAQAAGLIP